MIRQSTIQLLLLIFIGLFLSIQNPESYAQFQKPGRNLSQQRANVEEPKLSININPSVGSKEAPLLFAIGLHIEAFGTKPSSFVSDSFSPPTPAMSPQSEGVGPRQKPDYLNPDYFNIHLNSIRELERIVEQHNGKLVVQTQTPFSQILVDRNNTLLSDLEKKGHEIALHFHEDAHLTKNADNLTSDTWTHVMKEEIDIIKKAGATKVLYWSGGNLYSKLLDAAYMAGLRVMSDYKNRKTQSSTKELLDINPWRPSGGPSENDLNKFAQHDPNGKIIYLPTGLQSSDNFEPRKTIKKRDEGAYFDLLTGDLEQSLKSVKKDRVNVFHITVHPGEFGGKNRGRPFGILDTWLTQIIDPLVKSGKVQWATFSEMSESFKQWEKNNPGVSPRVDSYSHQASQPENSSFSRDQKGYISFIINVHDTVHPKESAQTLDKLTTLLTKNGVRGDFYLTAPMLHAYKEKAPFIIDRLKETNMTISYHVRPPHPIYKGFDSQLKILTDNQLTETLINYETYRLNMETGGLIKEEPGGYRYVKKVFGKAPVVVGVPSPDKRIKQEILKIYKDLGAQMAVFFHESGSKMNMPFEYRYNVLARPSDFSITRWQVKPQGPNSFWWNKLSTPEKNLYIPVEYLKKRLSEWTGIRPPFITVLIHENDFMYKGGTPWNHVYFADPKKQTPLSPPYNLNAPDASSPRTEQDKNDIWQAYEDMVIYAAKNLNVVTSEDIVALSKKQK